MQDIKIQSIDTENIEKDDAFENAYAFYVKIIPNPNYDWIVVFEEAWHNMIYAMKREATISGNKVRLVFGKGDNLQPYIDFLKQVIEYTNKRYNEAYEKAVSKEEARKKKLDDDKRSIKSKLQELTF